MKRIVILVGFLTSYQVTCAPVPEDPAVDAALGGALGGDVPAASVPVAAVAEAAPASDAVPVASPAAPVASPADPAPVPAPAVDAVPGATPAVVPAPAAPAVQATAPASNGAQAATLAGAPAESVPAAAPGSVTVQVKVKAGQEPGTHNNTFKSRMMKFEEMISAGASRDHIGLSGAEARRRVNQENTRYPVLVKDVRRKSISFPPSFTVSLASNDDSKLTF